MPAPIATLVYVALILGLFWLDRDYSAKTSKALWIPVCWLLINGSRPVSLWFQSGLVIDSPEKYLDGSPVDAAVFGLLLAAGLIVLIKRGRQVNALLRANLPLILFFSYCAVSVIWSDYTFVAAKRWIKSTGDIVMILIVLSDPEPLMAVRRLIARTAFVLLPVSLLFIKYYPDLGRGYDVWTWVPTYTGVTMGKNLLGMICLVFGLGCMWRFLSGYREKKGKKRTRSLIAHGSIAALAVWLLLTANSMTSLSCFVLASFLMAIVTIYPRIARTATIHLLVLLVVGASFATLFLNVGGDALQAMGRDQTLTGRTEIWAIVAGLVKHPLIGTGFESFWLGERLQKVWDAFGLRIQEAHNGYIEIYLSLGWIGILFLGSFIVTGYRSMVSGFRREPEISRLRLAFFVAALIYSFTEAGFRMMSTIWFAFIFAAMARAASAGRSMVKREARSRPFSSGFQDLRNTALKTPTRALVR